MDEIVYRSPELGDEAQIAACMCASADWAELTGETPEGIADWQQLCSAEELQARILSGEKTLVAVHNRIVVGFIAFRRGNHLSLLFVRQEYSGKGIGRELLTRCTNGFEQITVNASDLAVGFYRRLGFEQSDDRFFKNGSWGTPMRWSKSKDQPE
ncbi:GNAT family N-acetyltransferase [Microcoleus sp. FACHB-1515]|nr:GNAT family N-acetyltransferase [Microcoleus sp. FACHB-1515]